MKDNYKDLSKVLSLALQQTSEGKGKERHAQETEFKKQPIFWIEENFKSFQLGQAVKKMHESQFLPADKARHELLGAINYIAYHYLCVEPEKTLYEKHKKKVTKAEVEQYSVLQNLKDITEGKEIA